MPDAKKKLAIFQKSQSIAHTGTCTLSGQNHIVWIATKAFDVFLYPIQRDFLVPKPIVGLVASFPEFIRRQEPKKTQPVAL